MLENLIILQNLHFDLPTHCYHGILGSLVQSHGPWHHLLPGLTRQIQAPYDFNKLNSNISNRNATTIKGINELEKSKRKYELNTSDGRIISE